MLKNIIMTIIIITIIIIATVIILCGAWEGIFTFKYPGLRHGSPKIPALAPYACFLCD